MSDSSGRTLARPRLWWLAVAIGATPHVVLIASMARPREIGWLATDLASVPYTIFSRSELVIVPVTVLFAIALAIPRTTRPWALWLLLGTLAGATAVLMTLAAEATAWSEGTGFDFSG
jgi:hypothetical protein